MNCLSSFIETHPCNVKAALLRCRTAFFRISEQQFKQPDHQRHGQEDVYKRQHLHQNSLQAEGPKSQLQRTTMMVLAVTLHNIPEGMAVGVVYAGYLSLIHILERC